MTVTEGSVIYYLLVVMFEALKWSALVVPLLVIVDEIRWSKRTTAKYNRKRKGE